MERFLGKYSELTYAVMRIVLGLLFASHGAMKLFGMFGGIPVPLEGQTLWAGIIEFAGGLLLTIGFGGGWIAFLCSGEMAFAYFIGHAPRGFWPLVNKGELAVIYCFVFLFMATKGSGRFSVDAMLAKKAP
jgi:putative oxidoreductase